MFTSYQGKPPKRLATGPSSQPSRLLIKSLQCRDLRLDSIQRWELGERASLPRGQRGLPSGDSLP